MWSLAAPRYEDAVRVVLFDHLGAGKSDQSAYDPVRHASLDGYVDDVVAICAALELHDVIFVGHPVSAMIGALASIWNPDRLAKLVIVGPSACYIIAAPTSVVSAPPMWSNCWGRWSATTSAGPPRWHRSSSPTLHGPPSRMNSHGTLREW